MNDFCVTFIPLAGRQVGNDCGPLEAQPAFQFQVGGAPRLRCWRCALTDAPMRRRSLAIAGVVGSLLLAIDHGDAVLGGQWAAALVWKVALTYLVPFVVAELRDRVSAQCLERCECLAQAR